MYFKGGHKFITYPPGNVRNILEAFPFQHNSALLEFPLA